MVAADIWAYAAAGLVLAVFAGWLLVLSPRQRATRAFAVLLLSMGLAWAQNLAGALLDASGRMAIRAVAPMAVTGIGLSTIYFLSVYPRPRGWLGRSRWGGWTMAAVWAALAVPFLLAPDLYVRLRVVDGAVVFLGTGPLILLGSAWTITALVMLSIFALELRRLPAGPVRRALLLVICAFLTSILVWTTSLLLNDVSGRLAPTAIDAEYSRLQYALEEAALVLALAIAAVVVLHGWRSPSDVVRREAHGLAALVLGCLTAAALATFAFPPPGPEDWISVSQGIVDAAGGIAIAAFAGYALLKHRLFDIEVKLKWTIRRGTVAAVFIAVFLGAAEVAQNVLSETQGYIAGGIAAGLLLFAIVPLQRWAEGVADRALPTVRDSDDWRVEKKRELYRMAVGVALADKVVSREEERHLAKLAEELGLGPVEALSIREGVEREAAGGLASAASIE